MWVVKPRVDGKVPIIAMDAAARRRPSRCMGGYMRIGQISK